MKHSKPCAHYRTSRRGKKFVVNRHVPKQHKPKKSYGSGLDPYMEIDKPRPRRRKLSDVPRPYGTIRQEDESDFFEESKQSKPVFKRKLKGDLNG